MNKSLYLALKCARIFVRGLYLLEEASFEEQIISKDKYPSIFLLNIEAFEFIFLEIFLAVRAVLKIVEYPTIIYGSGGE